MNRIYTIAIIVVLLLLAYWFFPHIETFDTVEPQFYNQLVYLISKLDSIGTKYWITYNTLLSTVLFNDINDGYFEIGTTVDNYDRIIELNKTIRGDLYNIVGEEIDATKLSDSTTKKMLSNTLFLQYKNITVGKILFYYKCNDDYMRRYDPKTKLLEYPQSTFHSYFINNLVRLRIRNNYFFAPSNCEYLLGYWYGQDWLNRLDNRDEQLSNYENKSGVRLIDQKNLLAYKTIWGVPHLVEQIDFIYPRTSIAWFKENETL